MFVTVKTYLRCLQLSVSFQENVFYHKIEYLRVGNLFCHELSLVLYLEIMHSARNEIPLTLTSMKKAKRLYLFTPSNFLMIICL